MIFLTVGSELPFDRLVRATDKWCAARGRNDVYGQIATTAADGYRPANFDWCEFLSPDDYDKYCRDADLIIGHAGMGSIITAMTYVKPIVLMPRRAVFKETRNDHQVATAERLRSRDGISVAQDETHLIEVLDRAVARRTDRSALPQIPLGPYADPQLLKAIREFILAG